jgi:hypothetical protein
MKMGSDSGMVTYAAGQYVLHADAMQRIAQLERERDEWKMRAEEAEGKPVHYYERWEAAAKLNSHYEMKLETALARVAELEEVNAELADATEYLLAWRDVLTMALKGTV